MTAAFAPTPDPAREDLGAILAHLTPRLLRVALRYTRNPDASADVVQNAVEKAVRHHAQFRGHAQLSTWIHRIVVNEALMWLRSDRRRAGRSVPFEQAAASTIPDAAPSALDRILASECDHRVRRAVAGLPPGERELIERRTMEGEDYASSGARHGLRAEAVKSRAWRARRRLQERIAAIG